MALRKGSKPIWVKTEGLDAEHESPVPVRACALKRPGTSDLDPFAGKEAPGLTSPRGGGPEAG
jgi:hypothetical protein